jgi:hypothetical protein
MQFSREISQFSTDLKSQKKIQKLNSLTRFSHKISIAQNSSNLNAKINLKAHSIN